MSNKARYGFCLSPAEERVVQLVSEGQSDKLIGRQLGKFYKTVTDQVNSAKRKLGARTRAHLVSLWMRSRIG